MQDAPDASVLGRVKGSIDVDHVSFAYQADLAVLHDVDLHIRPGEMLLTAGEQGPPLSHIGVESLRHGTDIIVDLRQFCRLGHLLLRGPGTAVADILQNTGPPPLWTV